MKSILVTIVVVFFFNKVNAQKEANNWYFGYGAALTFNSSPVSALFDNQLIPIEGCSSISDKNGHLLLYTDGYLVINSLQHQINNFGSYLTGSPSSTQAALIVPIPESLSIFYIFTVHEQGGSLNYSIVDISKNSGAGLIDLATTNTVLFKNSTEKVTAVKHKNGKDIWVIGHRWNSNEFDSWLITKDGISKTPVISNIGSYHIRQNSADLQDTAYNARGYMKLSPDGKHLAVAVMTPANFVEVFDFNSSTGLITNPQKLDGFNTNYSDGAYGIEFSPNGNLLYISEYVHGGYLIPDGHLYQVKIPFSSGKINDRSIILNTAKGMGALQNAPDGKIYQAIYDGKNLSVINNPNIPGKGCDYNDQTISLGSRTSEAGLPNFVESYFAEQFSINIFGNCANNLSSFQFMSTRTKPDSVFWNFDDIASGKQNYSSLTSPQHRYTKGGVYEVSVKEFYNGIFSQYSQSITILNSPTVNLGNDTTLMFGQKLTLFAGDNTNTTKWNDGSTSLSYEVKAPGVYSATVTNASGCSSSDTINIKYDQIIDVNFPKDTIMCEGQSILLSAQLTGATYKWSNGSTSPVISVNNAGIYWVDITNVYGNRTKRYTVVVNNYKFDPITTISDTTICGNNSIILTANGAKGNEKYFWYDENGRFLIQNGGIYKTPLLTKSTSFYVELTNGICSSAQSKINVVVSKVVSKIYNKDTTIDIGASVQLNASGGKRYIWQPALYLNNSTLSNPVSKPKEDITYQLIVYNDLGCQSDVSTIKISLRKSLSSPNTFSPNGDGVNDFWVIKNIEQYPNNSITIYNRYGTVTNNFENYTNNWDGTSNSRPLPVGTYYYLIRFGKNQTQSGSITILR